MATDFLSPIDLNNNEIQNFVVHMLASDPTTPVEGQIWVNTTSDDLKIRLNGVTEIVATGVISSGVMSLTVDNTSIENIGTATDPSIRVKALGITNAMLAGSIALTKLATDPLARGNHTGTQTASTISDFNAAAQAAADDLRLDQFAAPNTSVGFGSQRITNLADPTGAQDAATKAYADGLIQGVRWKEPVRAATTAAGTLASSFENGDVIDGVTLATGNRILVKNQADPAENGIYTVNVTGAPTRAPDSDTATEITGASVFVSEGTTNGNTVWAMTTDAPVTLGTTGLVFTQIAGLGSYTAGTGLTLTGTQFSLTAPVTIALGGTNATTAAGAKTNLGFMTRFAQDIGDGSTTVITVTHNLNTKDCVVSVHRVASPFDVVFCDVEKSTVNAVILRFSVAPTAAQYRVTIIG